MDIRCEHGVSIDTTTIEKQYITKSYIIHISTATERAEIVKSIVDLTGAEVFEGIIIPGNGHKGCTMSHLTIYKQVPEDNDLLIFEDDCEILDPSFVTYIEEKKKQYDVVFIGINSRDFDINKRECSYGTHAMWISRKALDIFIEHFPKTNTEAIDHIWNEIEHIYNLKYFRPKEPYQFVRQKPGLLSYINGKARP
jgi:hypothetical protein